MKKQTHATKKPANHFPMGIHESWFEVPDQARDRAFCDRRGCECGNLEKSHQGSLVQAVADALYLDGSWHRYESSRSAWLEVPSSSSESYLRNDQMLEASCEVMMSQTLLRNFAEQVLQVLRKRVRAAEERGFDVELPCLNGIEEACAYYQSVQLFTQFKKDAAALLRIRGENDSLLLQPDIAAGIPSK